MPFKCFSKLGPRTRSLVSDVLWPEGFGIWELQWIEVWFSGGHVMSPLSLLEVHVNESYAVLEDLSLYRWSFQNHFNRFSNGPCCVRNWWPFSRILTHMDHLESPGGARVTEVRTRTDCGIEKEYIVTLQDSLVSAWKPVSASWSRGKASQPPRRNHVIFSVDHTYLIFLSARDFDPVWKSVS